MPKKGSAPLYVLILLSARLLFADDGGDSIVFSRPVLYLSQEMTRIVNGGEDGINTNGGLNGDWILPTSGGVDFLVRKNRRLGLEVQLNVTYFAAPYEYDVAQNFVRNISVTTPRLDVSYLFGNPSHPFLRMDAGIFNYKYDEYSRDLGEYMFRTWAYPGIIQTGGAYGYVGAPNNSATLTGIKFSDSLGMFSQDFLATIETQLTPIYDLNLTYMARFNYHSILKIGGGVQLARIFSANSYPQMTPQYFQDNGTYYACGTEGSGNCSIGYSYYTDVQQGLQSKLNSKGSLSHADSVQLTQATMALAVVDSVNTGELKPHMLDYTAQAVKPLFYFSFDPKPLFSSNLFGKNDLVVYGEAAILGTQNYPVFYQDVWQRIPAMLGFNLPAFKFLNVFSAEVEYYGSRWLPTYNYTTSYNAVPVPYMTYPASDYPGEWNRDHWKWSVYAERTLLPGVTLSGQVASDHSRSWDWDQFGQTPWEIYVSPSQWYWGLKLGVKI